METIVQDISTCRDPFSDRYSLINEETERVRERERETETETERQRDRERQPKRKRGLE